MKTRFFFCLLLSLNGVASAVTLPAPDRPGDSLIGSSPQDVKYVAAREEDTLIDIASKFKLGQDEIVLANPNVDRWLPRQGTPVRIPTSFVLPDAPHEGIVINLPEMRFYYYPDATRVITYVIGIGRVDWKTPLGKTRIQDKIANPSWTPPASVIAEHLADGDVLDPYYPPGPDNPLGLFAFHLGIPGYLIHSTNRVNGVGMRVSHGCIRMYPDDIEQFFPLVKPGTQVNLVNQPIKVGWHHDTLYLETYPELEENPVSFEQRLHTALALIERANGGKMPVIKGSVLKAALEKPTAWPIAIYQRPPTIQPAAVTAATPVAK
jgi:L,D-transpeptidase ErfK/SrfK